MPGQLVESNQRAQSAQGGLFSQLTVQQACVLCEYGQFCLFVCLSEVCSRSSRPLLSLRGRQRHTTDQCSMTHLHADDALTGTRIVLRALLGGRVFDELWCTRSSRQRFGLCSRDLALHQPVQSCTCFTGLFVNLLLIRPLCNL